MFAFGLYSLRLRKIRSRVLLCLLLCMATSPAWAQLEEIQDESPAARDKKYAALAKEAEYLQRYFRHIKQVIKVVGPTVVHIEATKAERTQLRYGAQGRVEESGSGVIVEIGKKKYVLTNRHVIKYAEPEDIKIKLSDQRVIRPTKTWLDSGTDIAVMQVQGAGLTPARLGNSNKLEIGDFVIAVGSPFGLSHSVTYGIISAKGRRDLKLGEEGVRFQDFMQTDAAINPGNSGGPLMNLRGELIGINTAIASASGGNEGIGFTIPINMVIIVAKQLVEKGTVARAFLGVNLDSKFGPAVAARLGLSRPSGARITGITPGSPADKAEIELNDVILSFNGVPVEDDAHLVNLVGLTEIGKEVPVSIFRDGKLIEIKVSVSDRKTFEK